MDVRTLPIRKADKGHSLVKMEKGYRDGFLRQVRYTCECGHKVGSTRGDQDGVSRRFAVHKKEN